MHTWSYQMEASCNFVSIVLSITPFTCRPGKKRNKCQSCGAQRCGGCGRRKKWCVWNGTVSENIWINLHITCGDDRKQLQNHNPFFLEWHCTKFPNSKKQMMVNSLWQHENTQLFTKVYKDTKLEGIKEALCVILLPYRLHNKSQVALLRKLKKKKKSDLHGHFNKSLFFHKNRFYKVCRTKGQTNTWLCACVCWETLWLNTPATIASTAYLKLTKGWYRGKNRGRKCYEVISDCLHT